MARLQKAIFPLRRAMFSQVPPAGFSESLLPTQSHNNPSASNAASARAVTAPALMENNTLNSHAVRASKSRACALRCSVSPRSLVFLQSVCIFLLLCFCSRANISLFARKRHSVHRARYQNVRCFMRCVKIGTVARVEPLRTTLACTSEKSLREKESGSGSLCGAFQHTDARQIDASR